MKHAFYIFNKHFSIILIKNFTTTTDFNSHIDINHIREQTKEQLKEESFSIEKVSLNIQKIRDKQQLQNTSIKKIKI